MTSRHVLTLNLKDAPGVVEAYDRHHREVWPEVRDSLLREGVSRMDIYRLGRRLVMVVETRDGLDVRAVFRAHAQAGARVEEWETLMRSLQEPVPDARAGEWWAAMAPVFHLGQGEGAPGLSKEQEPGVAHVDSSRAL